MIVEIIKHEEKMYLFKSNGDVFTYNYERSAWEIIAQFTAQLFYQINICYIVYMGAWFKQFEALIWAASLGTVAILYLLGTFATQSALAEKEKNLTSYVDQRHDEVQRQLSEMKAILYRIDQRVYDMRHLDKK